MPKVYSEEKRAEINEKLMDIGLELIKQYGIKKLSIEALTKKVGIAQGTFYNFYKSKEILVYNIANRYQEKVNARAKYLIVTKGYLDRADLQAFYHRMILEDEDNVYRFLKREDMQILMTRLPQDYYDRITDQKAEAERNLCYVRGKKAECDLDAVINWIQIMNLTVENKDILIETGLGKIIDRMIENMLDEIF